MQVVDPEHGRVLALAAAEQRLPLRGGPGLEEGFVTRGDDADGLGPDDGRFRQEM